MKREYKGPDGLPKRGYAKLVKKHAGRRVSIGQIQNYYQGRPVNIQAQEIIISATQKAVKEYRNKISRIAKMKPAA